ncbi:phosphoribosyltransferase family protein [Janthinobacterium fluminis]|uniref:Phosphoribosyltransferase family protein n=1 Tax=Janthinobacterium fluminis TaxID=2987524 RepID=A0ABT5K077_9BURK|nr:alpha/beta family hydrolase [Janthinobacterium fluminis]MDC8758378.1 phosphoribosyltransferase family protein [Janthinobacterium fluminis]
MGIATFQRFKNRADAGRLLARRLARYARHGDAIVLALPRGGVPVGVAVAAALGLACDVLVVRKLGFPLQEELAMGAVASGGLRVLQEDVLRAFHVPAALIEAATRRELREVARRERQYRRDRPAPVLRGRTVILVDDGVATGATMRVAVQLVRQAHPKRLVIAVPVCAQEARVQLGALVDECVCLSVPQPFRAVGAWYGNFEQISDAEVETMLRDCWREAPAASAAPGAEQMPGEARTGAAMEEQLIKIDVDGVQLDGVLMLPAKPKGVVLFAHGSGSGRLSPRNNAVASALCEAGMAALLLDLLNPQEEKDFYNRFDITLLTQRLGKAADWLAHHDATRGLPLGLFGASTGAAAALQLAAWRGTDIAAVVSRGGRPDMAGRPALEQVRAPTLLIVGGLDNDVIDLNRMAFSALHSDKQLEVINGAGHLFEEPGALQAVAALATSWFSRQFVGKV